MKKQIIFIFFILFLTSCGGKSLPITTPSNINYHNELLTWDAVPEATGYQCIIDSFVYEVSDTYFDTSVLPMGIHDVKIITVIGSRYSEPSENYTFTIIRDLVPPSNIHIEEDTLLWDAVPLVIGYIVEINGIQENVKVTSFSLSDLPRNAFYDITVTSIYTNNCFSHPSSIFSYHTFIDAFEVWEYAYHKGQEAPLTIDLRTLSSAVIALHDEEDEELPSDDVVIGDDEITITSTFLESYSYGEYTYSLFTSEGKIIIHLTIGDARKPHIIGTGDYTFQPSTPIISTFELYDGQIIGIVGGTIGEGDYVIEGNTLTLLSDYLDREFSSTSRNLLLLSITIESEVHLVITYILISR